MISLQAPSQVHVGQPDVVAQPGIAGVGYQHGIGHGASLPAGWHPWGVAESLDEMRQRRDRECRLTPDRALESIGQAHEFLAERGLLTRTADCALPSLYEACHEDPYQVGGRGFASWPATKWPWVHALSEDFADVHSLDIHRGKTILLSDELVALVDPICRAELARMETEEPGWGRLLRHLAETGPSVADDVELELGLKGKELKQLRSPLQRCGALVARSVELPSESGKRPRAPQRASPLGPNTRCRSRRSEADIVALIGQPCGPPWGAGQRPGPLVQLALAAACRSG